MMTLSKLEVGVPSRKLKVPPKSCIPSRAKMKMKRKSRKRSDMMEAKAFIRAITRLRSDIQYLKGKEKAMRVVTVRGMAPTEFWKSSPKEVIFRAIVA